MTLGKIKGGNYERGVCRKLSLWISHGERDDLLWRSAMSGGRATIGLNKGLKRKAQVGDISAIDALADALLDVVSIECKNYKNLEIVSSIIRNNGLLYDFWFDHRRKCLQFGKHPLLIAKQNYYPDLCLMDRFCVDLFGLENRIFCDLKLWKCYWILLDEFLLFAKLPDGKLPLPDASVRIKLEEEYAV